MQKFSILWWCLFVVGCAMRGQPAPIENITTVPSYLQTGQVTATKSSTNNPASQQANPVNADGANAGTATTLSALPANDGAIQATTVTENHPQASQPQSSSQPTANSKISVTPQLTAVSGWIVPTAGSTDGYKASIKGMDIYGNYGQNIYASNDGKVVYSGNGLKGYGNLIIIKHNNNYLTAYAHNKTNIAKEGSSVKRGQTIASMGYDDNNKAVLHFEVRQHGTPVDPFTLIKL